MPNSFSRTLLYLLLLFASFDGRAQTARVYAATESSAYVVGYDGKPVEGAFVVARWGVLDVPPVSLNFAVGHGSSGPRDNGRVLQISETRTDREGRFKIAGWGPSTITNAIADRYHSPQLLVFVPGYLPHDLRSEPSLGSQDLPILGAPQWQGRVLQLVSRPQDPKPYVDALARLQSTMLWESKLEQWKSMPQLTIALQKEKMKLGAEGARLLGLNHLPGRSGKGILVDAKSGVSVFAAVVGIDWSLRRKVAGTPRSALQLKQSDLFTDRGVFYVSPWRSMLPPFEDWEPVAEKSPVVRIYAPGYQTVRNLPWPESGLTIRLQAWGEGAAKLAELRSWKRDIDEVLAAGSNLDEQVVLQEELIGLLDRQCDRLPPDVKNGICFAPDSEVMRRLRGITGKRGAGYVTHMENHYGTYGVSSSISTISPTIRMPSCCATTPAVRGISVESAGTSPPSESKQK